MSNLERWHKVVKQRDPGALTSLVADDCVFHSPIVHTPQEGKDLTLLYLTAAMHVLGGDNFHYVREIVDGDDMMLEFETRHDDITINGVDIIRWNDQGRIVSFKVMVRPLKAINLLHQQMRDMLEHMADPV